MGHRPAVPLPAYIVDALGIKEGDSIETTLSTNVICRVAQTRPRRVAKATSELSRRLPADIKLGGDGANYLIASSIPTCCRLRHPLGRR